MHLCRAECVALSRFAEEVMRMMLKLLMCVQSPVVFCNKVENIFDLNLNSPS